MLVPHSASALHSTHVPLPSHTSVPPLPAHSASGSVFTVIGEQVPVV